MPTTACTSSVYNTVVTGYVPGTGSTTGSVVTFTTPKPDYGSSDNSTNLQCNAVTIGGFNGLNN
jgi:hypothetical protein